MALLDWPFAAVVWRLLVVVGSLLFSFGGLVSAAVTADFYIRPVGEAFHIQATLQGVDSNIRLSFTSQGAEPSSVGVTRVRNLRVQTPSGKPVAVITGKQRQYVLRGIHNSSLIIDYVIDSASPNWDFYQPTVTPGHIQLPVATTLFTLYTGAKLSEQVHVEATLHLQDLPGSWQVFTSCAGDDNSLRVVLGNDCVVHAGDYLTHHVRLGLTDFQIALSKELGYNSEVLRQVSRVLTEQYSLFGIYKSTTNSQQALVVINPVPQYAKKLEYGGRTLPGHVMFYTQPAERDADAAVKLVTNMAHETFHLWLGQGFAQYEDMFWFTEGFTQYQAVRTMRRLGLIDDAEAGRLLAAEFATAFYAQEKAPVSLKAAGFSVQKPGYRSLNYSKGALVAYLLERELNVAALPDRNFARLMRFLYGNYAVKNLPIGNKEVITAINQFVGHTYFTQHWVLESTKLTVADVPELKPYVEDELPSAMSVMVAGWLNNPKPLILYGIGGSIAFGAWYGMRFADAPQGVPRTTRRRRKRRAN